MGETLTQTCDRCGRIEAFPLPEPDRTDHWTLGPDGWVMVLVDWYLSLASWDEAALRYRRDFIVQHVCPDCVTEADQDDPHMSWPLRSGAALAIAH